MSRGTQIRFPSIRFIYRGSVNEGGPPPGQTGGHKFLKCFGHVIVIKKIAKSSIRLSILRSHAQDATKAMRKISIENDDSKLAMTIYIGGRTKAQLEKLLEDLNIPYKGKLRREMILEAVSGIQYTDAT